MHPQTIRFAILASLIIIVGVAARGNAQEAKPEGKPIAVVNFERFLNNHPKIADELVKNPTLINDSDYLAHHAALKQFLDTHSALRSAVQKAPGTIANHDGRYEWTRAATAHGEAGRFYEGYLYEHPDVAHQLAANPSLLDDPKYVAAHPGLQEYINTHPDIRTEMKRHPYSFEAGGRGRALH